MNTSSYQMSSLLVDACICRCGCCGGGGGLGEGRGEEGALSTYSLSIWMIGQHLDKTEIDIKVIKV